MKQLLSDSQAQTMVIYAVILLLGVLSSILPRLQESKKIPRSWQAWIDKISEPQIRQWIADAERLQTLTGNARRDWVVKQAEGYAADYLGEFIPHGIAVLVVEYVYQRFKKRLV
jgi:hypothetical protein